MKRIMILGLFVAACGKGTDQKRPPSSPPPSPAATAPVPPSAELPPMPRYPDAGSGRMVVQSAGPKGAEEIKRDWPAQAGWCEDPPMLQVKSEQVAVGGTLLLLALPANKITTYPVTLVKQGLPTPPAAQVGVQVFNRTGSAAFQAMEGTAEIYAWGKTVSGRFAVTLREINRNDRIQYAGAFREVPLVKLDSAYCTPAAAGAAPHP